MLLLRRSLHTTDVTSARRRAAVGERGRQPSAAARKALMSLKDDEKIREKEKEKEV